MHCVEFPWKLMTESTVLAFQPPPDQQDYGTSFAACKPTYHCMFSSLIQAFIHFFPKTLQFRFSIGTSAT